MFRKKKILILLLCIFVGVFFWTLDACLDYNCNLDIDKQHLSFFDQLYKKVPAHEVCIRSMLLGGFVIIGLFYNKLSDKSVKIDTRLRLSIENMMDGYFLHEAIFDKNGVMCDFKYVECNAAAQRMTGMLEKEIVGRTSCQVFPNIVRNGLMTKYIELMKNKEHMYIEDFHYYGDGINNSFDISCFITDEKHFVSIFRMITDKTKSEKQFRKIVEELHKSNKELEQFAYISSHDLQEPLRAVCSFAQLLKEKEYDKVDEESKKYFDYIINSGNRMKILIKELLDYSRVGRKDRPFEKINLKELLQEVLYNFEVLIKETNAEIFIEDDMPEILATRFRLKQLFHNIISNALKFRSTETPIIKINLEDHGNNWFFSIKDNGIGINTKYYERIFGVFKRLYSREQYPGTGIGLALCRKIVEAHGGEIWVESKVNEGTTVFFTISKVWAMG